MIIDDSGRGLSQVEEFNDERYQPIIPLPEGGQMGVGCGGIHHRDHVLDNYRPGKLICAPKISSR